MGKFFIILFLGLFAIEVSAQNQAPKIVETIKKEGYFFIPDSAFDKSVDGILFQLEHPEHRTFEDKTFQFYWSTLCNDGYYKLTITPEQIFFSEGHDNPNRNYLYWVQPIQKAQYEILAVKLKAKTPKGFHNYVKKYHQYHFADKAFQDKVKIPPNWTKDESMKFEKECKEQQQIQLGKYFSLLNTLLQDQTEKLEWSEEIKFQPKLFSAHRNELIEWLPVKKQ